MTADAVSRSTSLDVEQHPELRERHYGDLRGRPYTEVGEYILMEGYEPPNGESWEIFHARVDRAWQIVDRAAAETEGNLAVVTHGLVCYSLALRHLQLPDGTETPMRFGNTSLTVCEAGPPWSVSLLGCCAHLDEAAADDSRRPSGI
jgi:probable phosphoglycerate mutase